MPSFASVLVLIFFSVLSDDPFTLLSSARFWADGERDADPLKALRDGFPGSGDSSETAAPRRGDAAIAAAAAAAEGGVAVGAIDWICIMMSLSVPSAVAAASASLLPWLVLLLLLLL